MSVLRIRLLGDPVLRRRCKAIDRLTKDDRQLVDDMLETMAESNGAGLAAPQVGVSRRIIVVKTNDDESIALINPKISSRSHELVCGPEGCLSLPGLQADVRRPQRVNVQGRGVDNKKLEFDAEDIGGRAVCHEIDHLDGKLYIDRMEPDSLSWIMREENEETGEEEIVLEATTIEEARAYFRQMARRRR